MPLLSKVRFKGNRLLNDEVWPGLSREIPAWMCDAAACAVVSCGSPRLAIAALTGFASVDASIELSTRGALVAQIANECEKPR